MNAARHLAVWPGDCLSVTRLAFAALRHERIISSCLVLALGAIFTPLFILLGLKEGIIGTLLDRLQKDPDSRVVTPRFPLAQPLDPAWLEALRRRAAYVVASPSAYLMLDVEGLGEEVNVFPTTKDEPLLVENNIVLDAAMDQVVLSDRLARHAGKRVGDDLTLVLTRNAGREERYARTFRVAGILAQPGSRVNKLWIGQGLFDGLCYWLKGQALPELGLPGVKSALTPEYDGVVILMSRPVDWEAYPGRLGGETGLSRPPVRLQEPGWAVAAGQEAVLWHPVASRIFETTLRELVNRHAALGYAVQGVPYLEDFAVRLETAGGQHPLSLTILPEALAPEAPPDVPDGGPLVWCDPETLGDFGKCQAGVMKYAGEDPAREIAIPVTACPEAALASGFLALPRELAGKMRAARRQEAVYHPETGEFDLLDHGLRYFRAYAGSLADVEGLVAFVRAQGERQANQALLDPTSKVAEVRRIMQLSGYMEHLYLLVVLVSGVSCFFAVVASVLADIRRNRHDLALLQLLGLHSGALFLFPNIKNQILVCCGIGLALAASLGFGLLAPHLVPLDGGALVRLTAVQIAALAGGIFLTTLLASLVAALSILRIEPGEYIRE